MKEKICAVCGHRNEVSENILVNEFITTHSEGAKEYFDLWHFPIEKCENCGYSSRDIFKCENKNIQYLQSNKYNDLLKNLSEARPNDIRSYYDASRYYELIGDKKNQALCLIQAGDAVYNEIMYWKVYILTEDESCKELYDFAEELYLMGIQILKDYISINPSDLDMQILWAGVLNDSNDKSLSYAIINKLKQENLTNNQKNIINFLETEIY